jgi:hypothetical protein
MKVVSLIKCWSHGLKIRCLHTTNTALLHPLHQHTAAMPIVRADTNAMNNTTVLSSIRHAVIVSDHHDKAPQHQEKPTKDDVDYIPVGVQHLSAGPAYSLCRFSHDLRGVVAIAIASISRPVQEWPSKQQLALGSLQRALNDGIDKMGSSDPAGPPSMYMRALMRDMRQVLFLGALDRTLFDWEEDMVRTRSADGLCAYNSSTDYFEITMDRMSCAAEPNPMVYITSVLLHECSHSFLHAYGSGDCRSPSTLRTQATGLPGQNLRPTSRHSPKSISMKP